MITNQTALSSYGNSEFISRFKTNSLITFFLVFLVLLTNFFIYFLSKYFFKNQNNQILHALKENFISKISILKSSKPIILTDEILENHKIKHIDNNDKFLKFFIKEHLKYKIRFIGVFSILYLILISFLLIEIYINKKFNNVIGAIINILNSFLFYILDALLYMLFIYNIYILFYSNAYIHNIINSANGAIEFRKKKKLHYQLTGMNSITTIEDLNLPPINPSQRKDYHLDIKFQGKSLNGNL
jgi:hypothetical protein